MTGGFAGWSQNATTSLKYCSTTGTVNGYGYTGGLAGEIDNSTVDQCFSTVNVTSSHGYGGGLVGKLYTPEGTSAA